MPFQSIDDVALNVPANALKGSPVAGMTIPELVAEVYEAAPPAERQHLLKALMRPLGVLSLFGIASGVFGTIRIRSGWQDMNIRLEDLQSVRAAQVIALADHAQQVSVEAVDGLAQLLMTAPVMSSTAAAALLVTVLVQRAQVRQLIGGPGSAPSRIS
jgi:hypothetical protein